MHCPAVFLAVFLVATCISNITALQPTMQLDTLVTRTDGYHVDKWPFEDGIMTRQSDVPSVYSESSMFKKDYVAKTWSNSSKAHSESSMLGDMLAETQKIIASVGENVRDEIELELTPPEEPVLINKLGLAILNFVGLGLFGIDRCYVGQTVIGIVKGLTLGGVGVWFIIDWLVITINCFMCSSSLTMLGFQAQFQESGIAPSFYLALFIILISIVGCCCFRSSSFKRSSEERPLDTHQG